MKVQLHAPSILQHVPYSWWLILQPDTIQCVHPPSDFGQMARAPISSIINCPLTYCDWQHSDSTYLTPIANRNITFAQYTVMGDIGRKHEIAICPPTVDRRMWIVYMHHQYICMDMYNCVQEWIMYVHIRNLIYICWMLNIWLESYIQHSTYVYEIPYMYIHYSLLHTIVHIHTYILMMHVNNSHASIDCWGTYSYFMLSTYVPHNSVLCKSDMAVSNGSKISGVAMLPWFVNGAFLDA